MIGVHHWEYNKVAGDGSYRRANSIAGEIEKRRKRSNKGYGYGSVREGDARAVQKSRLVKCIGSRQGWKIETW